MIDFHTHILPNIDDGSKDSKESLELLKILEEQNVKLVCLTSHFYADNESIDSYIKRRNEAFAQLNYKGPLELKLGCEVHYYRGISVSEDIEKLCLEGTNLILVELPFELPINDNVINEIISLQNRGLKVVLAHFERYPISKNDLTRLKNSGVLLQSNCEFIIGSFFDSNGIKLLKEGLIDFIGSDSHNLDTRRPDYLNAINKIKEKLGEDFLNKFMDNCYKIIDEARIK